MVAVKKISSIKIVRRDGVAYLPKGARVVWRPDWDAWAAAASVIGLAGHTDAAPDGEALYWVRLDRPVSRRVRYMAKAHELTATVSA